MSLANDYRPKDWEDIVEQGLTVKILKQICESDELSCRNFLLTGSQGVGKTTCAKLMARKLNKDQDAEIIEVDAASNNGAEAMRLLAQQAQTYPLKGICKIIILDEVHALSASAWSVLLKVLEDQPAKTCWFLCTTNPEKIPKTILSRVQRFQLSKISLDGIIKRMQYVLDTEISKGRKISYCKESIAYIGKLANGGMRDALTLLDMALAYNSDLTTENVTTALALFNYDDFFSLLSAISKHDNTAIAQTIDRVYNSGTNFVKWFDEFQSFVINVAKYILVQDINMTKIPAHYDEKLSKYSMNHYMICLKLSNIVLSLCQELRTTNYQQEIALTRLCTLPVKKGGAE